VKKAAHCKVQGLSAVSCAKTAIPVEMPFGMWTRVGPRKRGITANLITELLQYDGKSQYEHDRWVPHSSFV